MNEQEILQRAAQMIREGKSDQEVQAWMQQQLAGGASARPSLPVAAPQDATAFSGRTPEEAKGEPMRFFPGGPTVGGTLETVAGMAIGGGVGGAVAGKVAPYLAQNLLGRAATGAIGSVAGGIPARAIMTPGDLSERLKAAANPKGMGVDALIGGVFGAAMSPMPKATRASAKTLSETIPRNIRKEVPNLISEHVGVPVEDPALALARGTKQLNADDAVRFAFLKNEGGGVVTDPTVLKQYQTLRESFPEVEKAALQSLDILKKAEGVPFDPTGLPDKPTLEYLHFFKQALSQPEQLAETRALSGKALSKVDLRSISKLGNNFRQLLADTYPEYGAAVGPSAEARRILDQGVEGVKDVSPTNKPFPKRGDPSTPGAIQETAQSLSPGELAARQKGAVGGFSLAKDPLKQANDPVVRDKMRALFGEGNTADIERALDPIEEADRLAKELKLGSQGLAETFGLAGAAGGSVQSGRLALGAHIIAALKRGHNLRKAARLPDLFRTRGPDYQELLAALRELSDLRRARTGLIGRVGGAAGGADLSKRYR